MKKFISLILAIILCLSLCLPVFATDTADAKDEEWHELNDGIEWQLVDEITEDGYYIILDEKDIRNDDGRIKRREFYFLRSTFEFLDNTAALDCKDKSELTEDEVGDSVPCPDAMCVWRAHPTAKGGDIKISLYSPYAQGYLSLKQLQSDVRGYFFDTQPDYFDVTFDRGYLAKINPGFELTGPGWHYINDSDGLFRFYKAVPKSRSVMTNDDDIFIDCNGDNATRIVFDGNTYQMIGSGETGKNSYGVAVADRPETAYTLLSEKSFNVTQFGKSNIYADSMLKQAIDALVPTGKEADVILPRDLEVDTYSAEAPYCDGVAGKKVENAYFWPLSTAEAAQYNGEINQDKTILYFWLRSPGINANVARYMYDHPTVAGYHRVSTYGIRPAFNLDGEKVVLFTEVGLNRNEISAVGYGKNEYKLTLKDEGHKDFQVTDAMRVGNTLTVNYTGASCNENDRIVFLVKNSFGSVIWYGNAGTPTGESGSVSFAVPEIKATDVLYIMEEEQNEGALTNYGSELIDISTKAIMLGSDIMKKGINTTNGPAVYFGSFDFGSGNEPMLYNVVGYGAKNDYLGIRMEDRKGNDFTLFAQKDLGWAKYDNSYSFERTSLFKLFSSAAPFGDDPEKEAVSPRRLIGSHSGSTTTDIFTTQTLCASGEIDTNILFWGPTPGEFWQINVELGRFNHIGDYPDEKALYYGYYLFGRKGQSDESFWIPCTASDKTYFDLNLKCPVGLVYYSEYNAIPVGFFVRPAFNLMGDKVVMTSAAVGGKPANIGNTLSTVGTNLSGEWKLTIADTAHKGFAVSNMTKTGNTVSFDYTGAQVGEKERISVISVDENGYPVRYGQISEVKNASGSVSFEMPEVDGLKYYVINEQVNGDKLSDFSSPLIEISPTTSPAGSILSWGYPWIVIAIPVLAITGVAALIIINKKKAK